ncbi:MAG: hypothetical protein ABSF36_00385 [Candidatus Methanomethylicaceae archaeon]|jgi:hypothetical protein
MSKEVKPPSVISGILFGLSLLLMISPTVVYILLLKLNFAMPTYQVQIVSLVPLAAGIILLLVARMRKLA